jgi:Family of unknown function (DUF6311)
VTADPALERNSPVDLFGRLRGLDTVGQSTCGQRGIAAWRIAFLALSFLAGLAYAFVVLGPRPLNPFNVSWMEGDPATAYLGWAFFRQEPHLTLPLGWSHAIGYPFGESAAYFDSIPIVALAGWLVRDFIPQNFQYFGIYFALCDMLQFYFGSRISRRVCGDDPVAGILGGALFLISPAFTWRAFGHFALASHWIILAALDQLLRTTGRPSRGEVLWSAAICFIAASVNPYIAAMVLLISCATYARPLMGQGRCLWQSCLGLGIAVCSTLLGLALFGFIRTADVSQYAAAGYGLYSMNLLAPIDPGAWPPQSAYHEALILRRQSIGPGQYEGYNYLGVGLLLLGIVSIARVPSSVYYLLRGRTVPVLVIFGLSLLLALSTKATLGNHVLYQLVLPEPITNALASFHASGRLFWPSYYLIFAGVIAAAARAFHGRWLHTALSAALVIQLLDLAPLRAAIHQQWQSTSAAAVPVEPSWRDLGRTQRHLVVLPPWQCSTADTPGGMNGYALYGRLALEQHMTINSFYAARYSEAQRKFFCNEQIAQIRRDGLRQDAAYIFARSMVSKLVGLKYEGNYCRYEDQVILCSREPGRSGLDPVVLQDIEILRTGDLVTFTGANKTAEHLISWGWSGPESRGRWMLGHSASLVFRLPGQLRRNLLIELSVIPFIPPAHQRQHLEITANGRLVMDGTFEQGTASDIRLVIPSSAIASDGLVRLDLNSADPASPAALGLSADERELSIGVRQLRVIDAGD